MQDCPLVGDAKNKKQRIAANKPGGGTMVTLVLIERFIVVFRQITIRRQIANLRKPSLYNFNCANRSLADKTALTVLCCCSRQRIVVFLTGMSCVTIPHCGIEVLLLKR